MKKAYGYIYKITNDLNGKVYIGQTIQLVVKRWNEHKKIARRGSGFAVHDAIRRHGVENFSIKEICRCSSQDELNRQETRYIKLYDSVVDNGHGYNLDSGGRGLGRHSEQTLKRMIESQNRDEIKAKIRASLKGYRHSEETKRKISLSNTGKKHSPETLAKMSAYMTGRPGTFRGRTHSEETRKRLSEAGRGRVAWNKGKTGIFSDEVIDKIRSARMRQPDPRLGKKHSPESRLKMRLAKLGKPGNFSGHHHSEEAKSKMRKSAMNRI